MSQFKSPAINSNIIPFVVDVMSCEITIFPKSFQICFTVRISTELQYQQYVCECHRLTVPQSQRNSCLKILSFTYPENYNDRA